MVVPLIGNVINDFFYTMLFPEDENKHKKLPYKQKIRDIPRNSSVQYSPEKNSILHAIKIARKNNSFPKVYFEKIKTDFE